MSLPSRKRTRSQYEEDRSQDVMQLDGDSMQVDDNDNGNGHLQRPTFNLLDRPIYEEDDGEDDLKPPKNAKRMKLGNEKEEQTEAEATPTPNNNRSPMVHKNFDILLDKFITCPFGDSMEEGPFDLWMFSRKANRIMRNASKSRAFMNRDSSKMDTKPSPSSSSWLPDLLSYEGMIVQFYGGDFVDSIDPDEFNNRWVELCELLINTVLPSIKLLCVNNLNGYASKEEEKEEESRSSSTNKLDMNKWCNDTTSILEQVLSKYKGLDRNELAYRLDDNVYSITTVDEIYFNLHEDYLEYTQSRLSGGVIYETLKNTMETKKSKDNSNLTNANQIDKSKYYNKRKDLMRAIVCNEIMGIRESNNLLFVMYILAEVVAHTWDLLHICLTTLFNTIVDERVLNITSKVNDNNPLNKEEDLASIFQKKISWMNRFCGLREIPILSMLSRYENCAAYSTIPCVREVDFLTDDKTMVDPKELAQLTSGEGIRGGIKIFTLDVNKMSSVSAEDFLMIDEDSTSGLTGTIVSFINEFLASSVPRTSIQYSNNCVNVSTLLQLRSKLPMNLLNNISQMLMDKIVSDDALLNKLTTINHNTLDKLGNSSLIMYDQEAPVFVMKDKNNVINSRASPPINVTIVSEVLPDLLNDDDGDDKMDIFDATSGKGPGSSGSDGGNGGGKNKESKRKQQQDKSSDNNNKGERSNSAGNLLLTLMTGDDDNDVEGGTKKQTEGAVRFTSEIASVETFEKYQLMEHESLVLNIPGANVDHPSTIEKILASLLNDRFFQILESAMGMEKALDDAGSNNGIGSNGSSSSSKLHYLNDLRTLAPLGTILSANINTNLSQKFGDISPSLLTQSMRLIIFTEVASSSVRASLTVIKRFLDESNIVDMNNNVDNITGSNWIKARAQTLSIAKICDSILIQLGEVRTTTTSSTPTQNLIKIMRKYDSNNLMKAVFEKLKSSVSSPSAMDGEDAENSNDILSDIADMTDIEMNSDILYNLFLSMDLVVQNARRTLAKILLCLEKTLHLIFCLPHMNRIKESTHQYHQQQQKQAEQKLSTRIQGCIDFYFSGLSTTTNDWELLYMERDSSQQKQLVDAESEYFLIRQYVTDANMDTINKTIQSRSSDTFTSKNIEDRDVVNDRYLHFMDSTKTLAKVICDLLDPRLDLLFAMADPLSKYYAKYNTSTSSKSIQKASTGKTTTITTTTTTTSETLTPAGKQKVVEVVTVNEGLNESTDNNNNNPDGNHIGLWHERNTLNSWFNAKYLKSELGSSFNLQLDTAWIPTILNLPNYLNDRLTGTSKDQDTRNSMILRSEKFTLIKNRMFSIQALFGDRKIVTGLIVTNMKSIASSGGSDATTSITNDNDLLNPVSNKFKRNFMGAILPTVYNAVMTTFNLYQTSSTMGNTKYTLPFFMGTSIKENWTNTPVPDTISDVTLRSIFYLLWTQTSNIIPTATLGRRVASGIKEVDAIGLGFSGTTRSEINTLTSFFSGVNTPSDKVNLMNSLSISIPNIVENNQYFNGLREVDKYGNILFSTPNIKYLSIDTRSPQTQDIISQLNALVTSGRIDSTSVMTSPILIDQTCKISPPELSTLYEFRVSQTTKAEILLSGFNLGGMFLNAANSAMKFYSCASLLFTWARKRGEVTRDGFRKFVTKNSGDSGGNRLNYHTMLSAHKLSDSDIRNLPMSTKFSASIIRNEALTDGMGEILSLLISSGFTVYECATILYGVYSNTWIHLFVGMAFMGSIYLFNKYIITIPLTAKVIIGAFVVGVPVIGFATTWGLEFLKNEVYSFISNTFNIISSNAKEYYNTTALNVSKLFSFLGKELHNKVGTENIAAAKERLGALISYISNSLSSSSPSIYSDAGGAASDIIAFAKQSRDAATTTTATSVVSSGGGNISVFKALTEIFPPIGIGNTSSATAASFVQGYVAPFTNIIKSATYFGLRLVLSAAVWILNKTADSKRFRNNPRVRKVLITVSTALSGIKSVSDYATNCLLIIDCFLKVWAVFGTLPASIGLLLAFIIAVLTRYAYNLLSERLTK